MVGETPERRSKRNAQLTHLQKSLLTLDARAPSDDETAAIRAALRGHATPGQSRVAMAYMLSELCGVGRVAFGGEKGIFLNGARAVGVALSQIGDVALMHFPTRED